MAEFIDPAVQANQRNLEATLKDSIAKVEGVAERANVAVTKLEKIGGAPETARAPRKAATPVPETSTSAIERAERDAAFDEKNLINLIQRRAEWMKKAQAGYLGEIGTAASGVARVSGGTVPYIEAAAAGLPQRGYETAAPSEAATIAAMQQVREAEAERSWLAEMRAAQQSPTTKALAAREPFSLGAGGGPSQAQTLEAQLGTARQAENVHAQAAEELAAAEKRAAAALAEDKARAVGSGPIGLGLKPQQATHPLVGFDEAFTKSQSDYARALSEMTPPQRSTIALAAQQAQEESKLGKALSYNVQQHALLDNALQRHGALTTEFIQATARGRVTMQEFGQQIGATIGKFAGWTGAAAAVYGALGAVTELGRGAVDASSGVQALTRFIPDLNRTQANQQIVGQAQELNLPIKDVTEASAAFARIFKNQGDVFTATHVALTASKLDNIALADSYRYLTALTQEYGLKANQLPGVFDQVAAAQNRLGARVSELLPALARSAAAVKNSGGDLNQLLALEAAAVVRTGQTGNVVGTAFARGSANFYRAPAAQATLSQFGINANQGFTQALVEAIQRGSEGDLSGAQRQAISKAFFGPLRGGLLAGLFTADPLVQRALQQTSPATTQGAAQRELNHVLGQADQQVKALGNNLQALGAALGSSGLLTPLGAMVKALNEGLTLTTDLLKVFEGLPKPLRDVAGSLAVILPSIGLLRRLDVGARLPGFLGGGPGGAFSRNPEQLARSQDLAALQEERSAILAQARNTSSQAIAATFATQQAERLRNEAFAVGSAATPAKQLAAQQAVANALARQATLENQVNAEVQLGVESEKAIVAYKQAIAEGLSAQLARQRAGLVTTLGTLQTNAFATPIGRGAAPTTASGVILPVGTRAAREAEARAAAATAAVEEDTAAIGGVGASLRAFIGSLGPLALAFAAITFGPGALRSIEDAQRRLAEAQQTVEPALTGSLPDLRVEQYVNQTEGNASQFSKLLTNINIALAKGTGDVHGAVDRALAATTRPESFGLGARTITTLGADNPLQRQLTDVNKKIKDASDFLSNAENFVIDGIKEQLGQDVKTSDVSPTDRLKQQRGVIEGLLKTQAKELYSGKAAIDLPASVIQAQVSGAIKDFQGGLISYGQLQQEFAKGIKEISLSPTLTTGEIAGIQQTIADLNARVHTRVSQIGADLKALSDTQLDRQISDYANYLHLFGTQSTQGRTALTHLTSVLGELAGRAAFDPSGVVDKSGATNLDRFAAGEATITAAIRQTVQSDLQLALATATSRAQRAAAYRTAAASERALTVGVRQAIADQKRYIATENAQVATLRAGLNETALATERVVQGVINGINSLTGAAQTILGAIGAIGKPANVAGLQLKQALAGLKQHEGALNFLQSFQSQADKLTQQEIAAFQGQADKALGKTKAVPTSEDPFELTRLRREIEQARAKDDPVKSAQIAEQLATEESAAAKNQRERLQGQLDLVNAQNEYDKAVQDLAQAKFTYQESKTTDPVKQAAIDVKKAAEAVQYEAKHGGTNTAAYYQSLTTQNQANQKLIETRISSKEDTIEFEYQLGQISAQTAIQEYEGLLHVHGITTQLRRQVLTRINELRKAGQSEFAALDLGTIRLPTPYEIRRAVQAAQGGLAVTNHYSTTIQVTDERAATKVGVVMDRYHSGTSKAIDRARGY